MGIDWFSCKNCGGTFPDCGDYVYCECGKHWCSNECASADGYTTYECKLGKDLDEYEDYCEEGCDKYKEDDDSCSSVKCEHFIYGGCNYCRGENYDDDELLEKALELLEMSREELIKKMN